MIKKTILSIFAGVLCVSFSGCIPHKTGTTDVGIRVKKINFTGKKGVEEKTYSPGAVYFFLPFINDWYTLDTRLFNLEMTINPYRGDKKGRDDLLFKTIDGNDISLDVVISYRIIPEKASYIIQYVASDDISLKNKIVRIIARSKPRDIFGELTTEDFYMAEKRSEKAHEAEENLNKILNPYGVIVEKVLTKDYRFNKAYQKAIEDKKVADQVAQQNKSAANAAKEEYIKQLEDTQGKVNEIIAKVDGQYLQAKIKADAYYEKQQKIAEAIKAEGLAEAEAITKMNEALFGTGGTNMVKLKIAEAMTNKEIILLPTNSSGLDLRSTDVNSLLKVYGAKSAASKKQG